VRLFFCLFSYYFCFFFTFFLFSHYFRFLTKSAGDALTFF
jgi:hypothetical protein